jgi:hypothetical protein
MIRVVYPGSRFFRLFWAQMALASLMPFQGPKKSRFSWPTPSNAPRNDVAPLKIITYRAIKTTDTLIVIIIIRCTEAEFLDVIGTKVLRVFLLAIHSHLC